MARDRKQVENNFIAEWNKIAKQITAVEINGEPFVVLKAGLKNKGKVLKLLIF